jgi:hypothetical protein
MLHPREDASSNNEAAETRIEDMIEKQAQAIDAINQTT